MVVEGTTEVTSTGASSRTSSAVEADDVAVAPEVALVTVTVYVKLAMLRVAFDRLPAGAWKSRRAAPRMAQAVALTGTCRVPLNTSSAMPTVTAVALSSFHSEPEKGREAR